MNALSTGRLPPAAAGWSAPQTQPFPSRKFPPPKLKSRWPGSSPSAFSLPFLAPLARRTESSLTLVPGNYGAGNIADTEREFYEDDAANFAALATAPHRTPAEHSSSDDDGSDQGPQRMSLSPGWAEDLIRDSEPDGEFGSETASATVGGWEVRPSQRHAGMRSSFSRCSIRA